MLGALVSLITAAWPLAPPPVADASACREWLVDAANVLAVTPQPPVAELEGAPGEGLADLPAEIWKEMATFHRDPSPGASARRAAALEGRAGLETVPELVAEAVRRAPTVRRILRAARSSRATLPVSVQNWEIFGVAAVPTHIDVGNVELLGNVLGWQALAAGKVDAALALCIDGWALTRDLGGTGLIGNMIAVSAARHARALCVAAAQRAGPEQRRGLRRTLEVIENQWLSMSTSLWQELVFVQVVFFSNRWPEAVRARLPPVAVKLHDEGAERDDSDWFARVRWSMFGSWAGNESCLLLARAARDADQSPSVADPSLRAGAARPLTTRLAKEGTQDDESWVRFARRSRTGRLELQFLLAALATWEGQPQAGNRVDPRTSKPLRVVGTGRERALVADGAPELDAQELRVVIGDATTSP